MDEKVKLVRTMSGEYLLATVDSASESVETLHLKNVRKLSIGMSMTGQASVALIPICPFSTKKLEEIDINRSQIMFTVDEAELQSEVVTSYKSEISGITLAPKGASDIII